MSGADSIEAKLKAAHPDPAPLIKGLQTPHDNWGGINVGAGSVWSTPLTYTQSTSALPAYTVINTSSSNSYNVSDVLSKA